MGSQCRLGFKTDADASCRLFSDLKIIGSSILFLKSSKGGDSACDSPYCGLTSDLPNGNAEWGWVEYWTLQLKNEFSGSDITASNKIEYESGVECDTLIIFQKEQNQI